MTPQTKRCFICCAVLLAIMTFLSFTYDTPTHQWRERINQGAKP